MILTYIPIPGSHHVYLNGIEMQEAVDWTETGGNLVFLPAMGVKSGDLVEVLYAHESDISPFIPGDFVAVDQVGGFSATDVSFSIPAHTAGDFLLAFFASDTATLTSPPVGWKLVATHVRSSPSGIVHVFSKIGGGAGGVTGTTAPISGLNWYATAVMVFTGGLSTVAEIAWGDRGPIINHSTPGVLGDGRIVHFISHYNFGGGGESGVYPDFGTKRFDFQIGNSWWICAADLLSEGEPIIFTGYSDEALTSTVATLRLA